MMMMMMMMRVDQSVESELTGETEILGENLHQGHFVHHKTDFTTDLILPAALWLLEIDSASNRNEYQKSSWE
jgi:hypothetical protein